jgi:hypothetical protein
MGRSNDLVPLFDKQPEGLGYRQGVIVSWNPDTAENQVIVAGTVMENLPAFNSSEASLLAPGNVVGLIAINGSWAILGRLIIPGSPEAASSIKSITNRIEASFDPDVGYRNSTSFGDLTGAAVGPSVTLRVGASGRALVFWSAELGVTDPLNWAGKNTPHVGVEVTQGATVINPPINGNALNFALEFPSSGNSGYALATFWFQAATMHLYKNIPAGTTTFTMKYKHDSLSPAGSSAFNSREIAVFAL